jgi:integrase
LDDLHAYDVMVTNSPKENDGLPRSQVTVSFLIEDIKDFYTYLYEAGVLASNVMAEFGPTLTKIKGRSASPTPKTVKIRKARRLNCIALTWAQVKRLFRYLATRKELIARRDRAMFLLMLHGGLKPHDIHEMLMKDFTALPSGGARLRLRHSGGTVDIPAALYRDIMAYRTAVTDHPATPDMPVFCSFKPQQPARWNCHTVVNHALTARSRAAGIKFNVDPSMLSKTKEALDAEDFDFVGLLLKQYPVKTAKKAKVKAAVKTKSKPVSAPPPEEKTLFDDVEDVVKSVEPPVKATAPVAVPAPQDDTPFLEWLTAQLHKAQRQARSLPGGEALEATLSELFDRVFRRVHPGADA